MSARDYDIKDQMLSKFAESLCKKIAKQTIRELRTYDEHIYDDSGLKNAWDEICVQVQFQEFINWDFYLDLIYNIVWKKIEPLKDYEKMTIWWQTDGPEDVLEEDEDDFESFIFDEDQVCNYIINKYILSVAADYTNKEIRDYLERYYTD